MKAGAEPLDATLLLRSLSGHWADRYSEEVLLPQLCRAVGLESVHLASLRERLLDPFHALEVFYAHYSFSRRGPERGLLSAAALEALDLTLGRAGFDSAGCDSSSLWDAFICGCVSRGLKAGEQLNFGPVAGVAELARQIYAEGNGNSLASWAIEGVLCSGSVEPQFQRLTQVRGVGPKLAAQFLRDIVFLHGLEEKVEFADRIYIQPLDKWLRAICQFVVPELESDNTPDWVLAGKLARHTRRAGISGVRFNMGASYYCLKEVRVPEALEARLRLLA